MGCGRSDGNAYLSFLSLTALGLGVRVAATIEDDVVAITITGVGVVVAAVVVHCRCCCRRAAAGGCHGC